MRKAFICRKFHMYTVHIIAHPSAEPKGLSQPENIGAKTNALHLSAQMNVKIGLVHLNGRHFSRSLFRLYFFQQPGAPGIQTFAAGA